MIAVALIQEQIGLVENLHKGKATVGAEVAGNAFIPGDEHGLRRAIYNLLLHGVEATKYTGTISVLCSDLDQSTLVVEMRDNGPGIPEKILPRIFEPFVTSKNEGTGLGLAIVKRIVTQHGGTIEARNDNGAVFTITLPR